MFELLFCSMLTVLPDYLFRRYGQGKRWGVEINIFSVWYELRWGITACVMLTLSLITTIFYYHPATTNVASIFRTVTVLPEAGGRVAEVMVGNQEQVEPGQVLFRLDDAAQVAAVDRAARAVEEIDAQMVLAEADLAAATGTVVQAESALAQAQEELDTKAGLAAGGSSVVSEREVERLQILVDGRQGALDAARASRQSAEARLSTLLPAQKATAEAALRAAEVDLDKTVIRAGIAGELTQFVLQPGDYVSALLRPAGIIVPSEGYTAGRDRMIAGFGQISAQVVKPGALAEITCASLPFTIVPMVVTQVQDVIASGQIRPTDRLIDLSQQGPPGLITATLEPLYAGQLDRIPPGSSCIANVYTNNHERLATEELGLGEFLFLHMVDTVGIVHALILRSQALLLPVRTLVLSGH